MRHSLATKPRTSTPISVPSSNDRLRGAVQGSYATTSSVCNLHHFNTVCSSADPINRHAATEGMVILEIGAERRKYFIHKALLTHHSEDFRRALTGDWKERQEGISQLHDVETGICKSSCCYLPFELSYGQRVHADAWQSTSLFAGSTLTAFQATATKSGSRSPSSIPTPASKLTDSGCMSKDTFSAVNSAHPTSGAQCLPSSRTRG